MLLNDEKQHRKASQTETDVREHPKILVWTWTEPDKPSGSPAVLAEILRRVPPGRAEIVCQNQTPADRRLPIDLPHPIRRLSFHRWFWPFSRVRWLGNVSRCVALPLLLAYGWFRILRFRPDCLYTIYMDDLWILSGYLLSRSTGIPIVYYVHDPYRERAEVRGRLAAWMARHIESRTLRHGHILVLYESLREHYLKRYGIQAKVVRHLARRTNVQAPDRGAPPSDRELVIGFSGQIYGNNDRQMQHLADICKRLPRLRLRVWTSAADSTLRRCGMLDDRIGVEFEKDYDRLIAKLAECDLLYLPLAFDGTDGLPRSSLQYVLPTKAVDYLATGVPILVHCPGDFELGRFFREHRAAYHLRANDREALEEWLHNWIENRHEPIDRAAMKAALEEFCPERNFQAHYRFLVDAVRSASAGFRAASPGPAS